MIPLSVLLVTMEPERRAQLAVPLMTAGHQVTPAASATDAREALDAPGVGAVLVDLMLPGLDRAALGRALSPASPVPPSSLADVESHHIAHMLRHTGGNKRQAALLLGISRSTLLHKIRRYDLSAVAVRRSPGE